MTPEGKVKADVKRELKLRGIWYFMPMQNGFGVVGIPDFICCWNGRFLAIETKAPKKRSHTTANQERQIADINAHGGYAIVVDDVSQLISFLQEHIP
jgi:hypothetical protein